MATITSHAPGTFCWFELGTTDQPAAKRFYHSIFGWVADDTPMGPDEFYTLFKIEGRDAAAGYTLRKDQQEHHVPAHWMIYVAVESADAAAQKAAALGGNVLAPPFDVMDYGRMSVLQDPTGGTFCVWQPKSNPGAGVAQQDGTVVWADLNSTDPAAASAFYQKLFGWHVTGGKDMSPAGPNDYGHIVNGRDFIGGVAPRGTLPHGVPSHWLLYFQVPDCDKTIAQTTAAGGRVLMPATAMENVRRFAVLTDPQGAAFAIVQNTRGDHSAQAR